jgi:serine protease inhibitor
LPKFEVRYGEKLNAALEAMGMGVAVNMEEADFSGITASQIYISDVEHKTYVKVDEKGTEAARRPQLSHALRRPAKVAESHLV